MYHADKDIFQADAMFCSPLRATPKLDKEMFVVISEYMPQSPIDTKIVKEHTRRDPLLSKVLHYITSKWLATCHDEDIRLY